MILHMILILGINATLEGSKIETLDQSALHAYLVNDPFSYPSSTFILFFIEETTFCIRWSEVLHENIPLFLVFYYFVL